MFQNLLVPVDGSEQSLRAVDAAVELAKRFDGAISVICVYRHHSPLEASLSMVRANVSVTTPDEAMKQFAKDIAKDARDRARAAGVKSVEAYARRGQPARTIVHFAEEHASDAIVMGTRGLGDFGGLLLGSVSHKVTSMAKVTCVLVK